MRVIDCLPNVKIICVYPNYELIKNAIYTIEKNVGYDLITLKETKFSQFSIDRFELVPVSLQSQSIKDLSKIIGVLDI